MMALVALCVYGGLLGLCLSMGKHYQQVFAGSPAGLTTTAFRTAGWLLLIVALVLSVTGERWSIGLLAWLGWLLAAGLCLVLCLATVPRAVLALFAILLSAGFVSA